MNKKYIDFVPTNKSRAGSSTRKTSVSTSHRSTVQRVTASEGAPVIETRKGSGVTEFEVNELFEARETRTRAGVSTGGRMPKPSMVQDYRQKFVKTEVKKRPLSATSKKTEKVVSKNVYQKKDAASKESGPVTIINKPEKDSKVGLVVTIIITIILGAAAGTVAFLLLK